MTNLQCKILSALLLSLSIMAQAQEPLTLSPGVSASAPVVDGNISDWDSSLFTTIAITPAIDEDTNNNLGEINAELAVLVANQHLYVAVKWPDPTESTEYRPWEWKGSKYRKGKDRDDMLAFRLEFSGEYDRSMLTKSIYMADVWVWSAARSNPAGYADDYLHTITTEYIENAAEYELDDGTIIYIDRSFDAGDKGYQNFKPDLKVKTETKVSSLEITSAQSRSAADVTAKGVWQDGFWVVEMSRALDTGNTDDKALISGQKVLSQIAIFEAINAEHKSISEPILLSIP